MPPGNRRFIYEGEFMPLLDIKNVSKEYVKGVKALSNVTFKVEEGEFISIIGPSGAGKSTLLRCINRLVEATDGDIVFDGRNIKEIPKKNLKTLRRNIGMIFQHYNLVMKSSVIENTLHGRQGYIGSLAGVLGIYPSEDRKEAYRVLESLGLKGFENKRCDRLSGGQQQRVGIARALMQKPKLILCDEPIASLDPSSARVIMEHLKEINEGQGITCILNLHQVDVAQAYSKRIIGINGGKVLFDGPSSELTQEMIHKIYGTKEGELIMDQVKS